MTRPGGLSSSQFVEMSAALSEIGWRMTAMKLPFKAFDERRDASPVHPDCG